MTTLVADLSDAVRDHPGATAVSVAGNDTTFAEFWALTGRFAGALRERGIDPGTGVALSLPNLPQFVVAFYGVLRAGAVVVPVDPSSGGSELREPLIASDVESIVTTLDRVSAVETVHEGTALQFIVTADGPGEYSTGFAEFLSEGAGAFDYWEVVDRDENDLAVLVQATTGEPNPVELTHGNLAAGAGAVSQLLAGGLSTEDATLGALPFWQAHGMTAAMAASLASGATLYPMPEWDPAEALALLADEELTVFHGSSSMYEDLLAHADADADADAGAGDLSSIRLAGVLGGASAETLQAFESAFDVPVHEGYGPTEAAGVTHYNAPSWGRQPGSVGKPVPGVFARIVDDGFEDVPPVEEGPVESDLDEHIGEIVVAGPNVTREGRLADDAVTTYDGRQWFHTGDAGYRDADDFYYVVGRLDGETYGDDTVTVEATANAGGEQSAVEEPTDLQDLDGISGSRAASLRDAGFESISDLRAADREALTDVKGFGDALVDRIEAQIDDSDR